MRYRAGQKKMILRPMIYVDVSHLHEFLRAEKPLSGIQRLTLNALVALTRKLGAIHIRGMIFSATHNAYRWCSVQAFLRDKGLGDFEFTICDFKPSDKIILPEYFWNKTVAKAAANRASFGGAKIFRIIHDVIPVALPRLFAFSWVWKFRRFANAAISGADVVLTDSDYSKSDIQKFFPKACAGKSVIAVKLPHEFLTSNEVLSGEVSQSQMPRGAEALHGQSFALMVGSLEARKNPQGAVKAWAQLARAHGPDMPKLVMVGAYTSHSWLYKTLLRRAIGSCPSILHLPACDDAGLKWLYENCRFSIFLSLYEGWGLPVGESLWFGKPVLASTSSSLPEVGPGMADYVDAKDEAVVMAGLRRMCFEEGYSERRAKNIATAKLRSWDDYANILADNLN